MNWYHVALALLVNAYLLGGLTIGAICLRIAMRDWWLMRFKHQHISARAEVTHALLAGVVAVLCWPYFAWQWWGPRK